MTHTPMRWLRAVAAGWLAAASFLAATGVAHATEAEDEKVVQEAREAALTGPQDIKLASQAVLHLPEGKTFIPQPHAARMMRVMGNPGDYSDLQGLIFPEGGGWFAIVRFEASGYVKDDDAKHWDADDLLKSYREGTESANEERQKMGVTPLEIVGWAEKPHYTADTHRLVWAMSTREKGGTSDQGDGVNYNTYALGREGYMTLNLVTDLKDLPQHKTQAQALLGALQFDAGKRYEDFNSSTDHVAEYGLAALVLGVGAKKLGLLAVIFAFLAKFAKVGLLAAFGVGGAVMKFFRREKKVEPPSP